MKRSSLCLQSDLFESVPALPALSTLEVQHDHLVELISLLLWEVASSMDETMTKESSHEQDQP